MPSASTLLNAFFPLLALALYKIYTDRSDSFRSLFSNSVLLAAAMTGIIGAHLLTTLMACLLMKAADEEHYMEALNRSAAEKLYFDDFGYVIYDIPDVPLFRNQIREPVK